MLKYTRYHFVGVAGVGMSAVAQAVGFNGTCVTGSDRYYDSKTEIPILDQLQENGIKIYTQDGSGVRDGADAVVISTAIENDNPDLIVARELGLPILHRSEVLAELIEGKTCIAIAGTSGKSTVTGMVGWILEQSGLDPYVVNGAPVINWQKDSLIGNARKGNGKLWVIEADESDHSLLNYAPEYAVITNMSADHFGLDDTIELFKDFATKVTGKIVGALDGCHYLDGVNADVTASSSKFIFRNVDFELPLPGKHNVEDALHATVLCELAGVSIEQSADALKSFRGIHRRLEVIGSYNGITVIDDYGHNPAKISAAWNAVIPFARRGIVIWRPHGYGPLRALLDDLNSTFSDLCNTDDSLLLLPVYDAGGTTNRDINSDKLVNLLTNKGINARCVESHDEVVNIAAKEAQQDDAIIVMGARDPKLPELARRILSAIEA